MYIARQPIFNKNRDVYGYELLYRSGSVSSGYDGTSSVQATATVIGGLFESGIDRLVDDKMAFINFDEEILRSDMSELIDPRRLVIEVLEDVVVSDDLINRLKDLKHKGYRIALDDFVESYAEYPLVPLADIIKFDIRLTPMETLWSVLKKAKSQQKLMLAEKIETEEEFQTALDMGFHLFQGFFFSRPNIVGKSLDKTTTKAQYGRIINELMRPEPSYQTLAEIIEKDAHLAYRLMRVVSSRSGDDLVYSIKRALTYMGLNEMERWIHILMIRDLGSNKPAELMRLSLIRTKFAERIALNGGLSKYRYEASMMGLFSTLDAILDQPMAEALSDVSLPSSISDVLVGRRGILLPVYNLLIAYERGAWLEAELISSQIGIGDLQIQEDYMQSLIWAKQIMDTMQ